MNDVNLQKVLKLKSMMYDLIVSQASHRHEIEKDQLEINRIHTEMSRLESDSK